MEECYFDICYRRNAKVRWICKILKFSRFLNVDSLRGLINEKVARIARRRGELDEDSVAQIGENLILAKIARRYIEKKTKPYQPRLTKKSPTPEFRENFPDIGFSFENSCGPIYKEKHYRLRTNPSILFPGFMPDGNEAFCKEWVDSSGSCRSKTCSP